MPEAIPSSRGGWTLPVFAAVAASAAVGFAFLYLVRPNAGELGRIGVVVSDDDGKTGNTVHITVAEAPFVQKEASCRGEIQRPGAVPATVSVAAAHQVAIVRQAACRTTVITEYGFSWMAKPLPDDMKDDARKDADSSKASSAPVDCFSSGEWEAEAGARIRRLHLGAEGRADAVGGDAAEDARTEGRFTTIHEKEAPVMFELPYAGPPHVELGGFSAGTTIITEVTATDFRWKNVAKSGTATKGQ